MIKTPIERFLNVKSAYRPDFSADGQTLSFIADLTGVGQAYRVKLNTPAGIIAWPEQLTFGQNRVMWLQNSPAEGDGRLLFTRDFGGNENAQLWLLDPASGQETCLSAGYEKAMHMVSEWSDDGRHILFAANREHPGLFGLYEQEIDSDEAMLLWQSEDPGYLYYATRHPSGKRIAFVRMGHSADHELLELDLASGRVRSLSSKDQVARYSNLCYSKDGRSLLLTTDLDSDFLHIARLDLITGGWEKLVYPDWDVEIMSLSPDGRYLAYTYNKEGYSQLELIDLATSMARPGPEAEAPRVIGWFDDLLAFSADSSQLAFSATNPTHSSDIYVWSLALDGDPEERRVTAVPHGGIPTESFVTPELIHYPSFDGRQIPAWLLRPTDSQGPHPVVVIVHGGPESQSRPIFSFVGQYLAHQGFAVLYPNVRGSTGYGNFYSHLDDVEKRLDSVKDLAQAAHWLQAHPDFDGNRVAVYGGSYGGFMVLAALAYHPELWAAGVNIVGISNFVTFLENTSDYRRQHRESEYGRLDTDREFLEDISPLNHTSQMTAPLLVIHGANDPRVPVGEAQQLVERLSNQGNEVDLLVFDDEGHGIAKLKNKLVAYPAIVEFLARKLAEGRSADNTK